MHSVSANASTRDMILDALQHLDHVLPGQGPIHDFVHHNTLHGFQHLPFEQALAEFEQLTGISSYWPEAQFREFYRQGRINDDDLNSAIAQHFSGAEQTETLALTGQILQRRDLYKLALLHDVSAISPERFSWECQEMAALQQLHTDIPPATRDIWRQSTESSPIGNLWQSLLDKLALNLTNLHPENLLDLSQEQAESWLTTDSASVRQQMRQTATANCDAMFAAVGEQLTLRGLLLAMTGVDVLDQVRPQLIRVCASLLDEGMAAWRLPGREHLSLFAAWRQNSAFDAQPFFNDLSDWNALKNNLPDDAPAAIEYLLIEMAIPHARWTDYLQRLALELPGWSGFINWRQQHPRYRAESRPQLADYLALRLSLDYCWLNQLCREQWRIEARFDKLQSYFHNHFDEFSVRQALFAGQLPEYLSQPAHKLLTPVSIPADEWQPLAERIWTWQHSPLADTAQSPINMYNQGWRLFRLCQLLAWPASVVQTLSQSQLLNLLVIIDDFDLPQRRMVWLVAYERHYQESLLQALRANHQRGRWAKRDSRPEAQIVFCMDDREEGIRRHLEELNPAIETLGAAGFFGVPMNYQGLDDQQTTALCPVVVIPSHDVAERSQPDQSTTLLRHQQGRKFKQSIANWLHHGLRRDALLAYPLTYLAAPFTLAGLVSKSFIPKTQQALLTMLGLAIAPDVPTHLHFSAADGSPPASPQQPRLGFTDQEQAERIAGFLRNTGLSYGFAELVVLMGHGSISQNNPHLAAYDCGACSGRHGGPNARLFAAMANRPEVRKLLAERGIIIPDDTWFIGAEHNTCDEDIVWYDQDALPAVRLPTLRKFAGDMQHAQRMSAHERCRRLASAPRNPTPKQALRHFQARAADFSQARPELGHATNAAALVGRRSLTQGAFFDRRLFLISYDPSQDADGTLLEGILLAVGPVGAGINLEYYFSTVNNERLGCGSKVPHNLTGLFAVMEGAASDLRTGLPRQMIEIHEAMRLQIIVEARTETLTAIYARQESLRELIGGGWVLLSAKDPDSGEISIFQRGVGFVPWQAEPVELPLRDNSPDCYRDETLPVPPMLIRQPEFREN